jgi:hypothetical protein
MVKRNSGVRAAKPLIFGVMFYRSLLSFLSHLANCNVNFCHHLASAVRCLSSVNFLHFNLLLWNPSAKWTDTNVTPFFYHHIVVIQHLVWSDRRLSVISKENVHNVKKKHVLISFKSYNCIMLLSFIKDIFLFNKIPLQHQIYSLSVHDIHSKSKKKTYIIKGSK